MIHIIPTRETNYSYIIEDTSKVLIVDPGEAKPVIDVLRREKLTPSAILLTHSHYDHKDGVDEIQNLFPEVIIVDKNWDTLSTSDEENRIDIIRTPGHTEDSCCFYLPEKGVIFTGDTLFTGLCGRVIDGTMTEMFNSLQKLTKLPRKTQIYPGHEYLNHALCFLKEIQRSSPFYKEISTKIYPSTNSTIGAEIDNNPFLNPKFNRFKFLRTKKGL